MSKLSALKKEARRAEEREDFVKAIEFYGRAVSVAKDDVSATFEVGLYNRIGDLYLKLDDTSQAVYHYLLAVDHYADDELYPAAIALCRKVLRVAPDQVDAYRKLARLHEATGLMADAREEMDRYLAGLWESGQVNGALEGLPELVGRLMDGPADLDEVRRLRDEGRTEEAFERLYRLWEDGSAGFETDDGADGRPVEGQPEEDEPVRDTGFPQTEPADRGSLGASLRRGWRDLFDGDDAGDAGQVRAGDGEREIPSGAASADPSEDASAPAAEREASAPPEDTPEDPSEEELEHVDDMAWLREVTVSRGRTDVDDAGAEAPGEADAAEPGEGAGDRASEIAAGDEAEAFAAGDEDAAGDEAEWVRDETERIADDTEILVGDIAPGDAASGDAAGHEGDAGAAEDAVRAASAEPPEEHADAGAVPEVEEAVEEAVEAPAGLPAELLVAAAESLTLRTEGPATLPANVAAPGLLRPAGPDVPEGRTAVAERPVDRALRTRLRATDGGRARGAPPPGPAFQTPGREDYLPAGAEVTAREPGAGLLWLSDQVAALGAMNRAEPVAVRPAFGPPPDLLVAAAAVLDRSASEESAPALPADVAGPALLGAGVAEEPWVAEAAVEERRERRPPEGPAFETPGRDDYLPAGAEVRARRPGAALAWLAGAVEHLHRLEWGEPAWLQSAREARARAAEALERVAGDEERPLALPADLAAPLLLPPARAEAVSADAAAESAVDELAAAPPDAAAARPAAAAGSGAGATPAGPDGPSFQTPGRDDYLPAGAEAENGVPSPALAWLAASVADIHRLDWGGPAWFDEPSRRSDVEPREGTGPRPDGFDPSEEEAAEATEEALALLAAQQAAAPAPAAETDESEADGAAAGEAESDGVEADDVGDDQAGAHELAAAGAEADEVGVDAGASEEAGSATAEAEPAASGPKPARPEPTPAPLEPAPPVPSAPGGDRRSSGGAEVSPPGDRPAVQPSGLDFTALLKRIGWLRSREDARAGRDGAAAADAEGSGAARNGDGAMEPAPAPWSRDASGPAESEGSPKGGDPPGVQPPTTGAPGSGVPDFTELLHKVGWLQEDERT